MIADDPQSIGSSISAIIADEIRFLKTRLYDAFPASQMASKYMETLICDASAITYYFCIPRDMNHPISDDFNNNTSHLVTDFLLYGNIHLLMDRQCIADDGVHSKPSSLFLPSNCFTTLGLASI